jgi:hypothetical protein
MLSHRGDASICHGSSSGSARDRVIVSYTEHVDVYAAPIGRVRWMGVR